MQVQLVDRSAAQGEQGAADLGQLVLDQPVPAGEGDVHLPELVHAGTVPVAPRLVGGASRLRGVAVQHQDGRAGPGQQERRGQTGRPGTEHHDLTDGPDVEIGGKLSG